MEKVKKPYKSIIMRLFILIFPVFTSIALFSQNTHSEYDGGFENQVSFGSLGITEIKVGDSVIFVEPHFIKDAWLPDSSQIIKDGFGFRQYKMWGQTRRYSYQYGQANGPFFFYDTSGNITKSGVCVNGNIDGDLFSYYPNGHLMSCERYIKSKIVKVLYYHNNAKLKSIVNYDNQGNRVGNFVQYHTNGTKQMTGQFSVLDSCQYIGSKTVLEGFSEDSIIMKGGIEYGEWKEYNEEGEVIQSIVYCGCEWYYEEVDMGKGLPSAYMKNFQPAECEE